MLKINAIWLEGLKSLTQRSFLFHGIHDIVMWRFSLLNVKSALEKCQPGNTFAILQIIHFFLKC